MCFLVRLVFENFVGVQYHKLMHSIVYNLGPSCLAIILFALCVFIEDLKKFCMLQIINQGIIFHPGSYCRDLWNILDATVVICALVAFAFS